MQKSETRFFFHAIRVICWRFQWFGIFSDFDKCEELKRHDDNGNFEKIEKNVPKKNWSLLWCCSGAALGSLWFNNAVAKQLWVAFEILFIDIAKICWIESLVKLSFYLSPTFFFLQCFSLPSFLFCFCPFPSFSCSISILFSSPSHPFSVSFSSIFHLLLIHFSAPSHSFFYSLLIQSKKHQPLPIRLLHPHLLFPTPSFNFKKKIIIFHLLIFSLTYLKCGVKWQIEKWAKHGDMLAIRVAGSFAAFWRQNECINYGKGKAKTNWSDYLLTEHSALHGIFIHFFSLW